MSKGSMQRPQQASKEEMDLRWEYVFAGKERKKEIEKELEKFKK